MANVGGSHVKSALNAKGATLPIRNVRYRMLATSSGAEQKC
jgi:hypothetical protein